jgi:hypothetical protein
VRLTAEFPDGTPPPSGPVQVRIDRAPPKGSGQPPSAAQLVTLGRPSGSNRAYEYSLPGVAEGDYTFTLVSPAVTPNPPKVSCTVLPPVGELDRVQMNEPGLREAAAESRGKFYTLADAARLPDELPEFEPVTLDQPCPPWRLWDHWALYALALALVWTEWVARKRRRLL